MRTRSAAAVVAAVLAVSACGQNRVPEVVAEAAVPIVTIDAVEESRAPVGAAAGGAVAAGLADAARSRTPAGGAVAAGLAEPVGG